MDVTFHKTKYFCQPSTSRGENTWSGGALLVVTISIFVGCQDLSDWATTNGNKPIDCKEEEEKFSGKNIKEANPLWLRSKKSCLT